MKKKLATLFFLTILNNALAQINSYNGENGCKKCYNGYISENRACDNCEKGHINFRIKCDICNGKPGGYELKNCPACHSCFLGSVFAGYKPCKICNGNGRCISCNGRGYCIACKDDYSGRSDGKCRECRGEGKSAALSKCPVCAGSGYCKHPKYPQEDNKCHGVGFFIKTIQKNPNITQADKDELALYIQKLKENISKNYYEKGNEFFSLNRYNFALQAYDSALIYLPNNKIALKKFNQTKSIIDSISKLTTYNFNYFNFPETGIKNFGKDFKTILFNYIGNSTKYIVKYSCNVNGNKELEIEGPENDMPMNAIDYPTSASLYGYHVNASKTFTYYITTKTHSIKVKVNNGEIKKTSESVNNNKLFLYKLSKMDNGIYNINIGNIIIDGETRDITPFISSYKSFGGPGYAVFSLIVPGLGKSMITRSSRGLGSLIFVIGSGAIGYNYKNKSELNYNNYMLSKNQDEMNTNYDQYKQNLLYSQVFFGAATFCWLYDIYSTYVIGKARKDQGYTKEKYKLSSSLATPVKTVKLKININ